MPKYTCRYVSNGIEYTCLMNAPSSAEAARRMSSLAWAPSCGPVGAPRRNWRFLSRAKEIGPLVLAGALGCWAVISIISDPEPQQIAALVEKFN